MREDAKVVVLKVDALGVGVGVRTRAAAQGGSSGNLVAHALDLLRVHRLLVLGAADLEVIEALLASGGDVSGGADGVGAAVGAGVTVGAIFL